MTYLCINRVTIDSDGTATGNEQLTAVRDIFSQPAPFDAVEQEPDWLSTPDASGNLAQPAEVRTADQAPPISPYELNGEPDQRWHAWRELHWGTKLDLNASELKSETGPIDDYTPGGSLTMSFYTAWCAPTHICNTLKQRYPNLLITWFYEVPDTQSSGYLSQPEPVVTPTA